MSKLTLIIKQKHLDDILSGEKKEEIREITPKNNSKYCQLDNEGNYIDLKKFGSLILCVGYNSGRPTIEVEVMDQELEILVDPDGKEIVYEHEGEEYLAASVVYHLGRIIKRENC